MNQKKVIFHIDVNSAFLSWEAVYRLKNSKSAVDIREIPSAIGGDIAKRHGIILAKSIPAKKYGITTGESVIEALKKCPHLYLAPPNHMLYKKYSKAFMDILKEYSPDIEKFSVDEAFIDVSGTRRLFGEPIDLAYTIKNRIRDELGFTVNIGISDVKLLAKMASDFRKPDMVHTLFREEIQQKMWPLPVEDLLYVGKATKKKLYSMGIRTIGELANTDKDILIANLKAHGELIWNFANGIDISLVETTPVKHKGYGNSTTLSVDVTDEETARMILLSLSETVSERLRKDSVRGELVSVNIKDNSFVNYSHQRILTQATNSTSEIFNISCELFFDMWDGTPIRLLGVSVGKLKEKEEAVQISLFETHNNQKREAADNAIDYIREKYGADSIKRASYIRKSNT